MAELQIFQISKLKRYAVGADFFPCLSAYSLCSLWLESCLLDF